MSATASRTSKKEPCGTCPRCRGIPTADPNWGFDQALVPGVLCVACRLPIGDEPYELDTGLARFGTMLFYHRRCKEKQKEDEMAKTKTKAPPQATLPNIDLNAASQGARTEVAVKDVRPSPFQVRSANAIADLADSIKQDGLLQPITVRSLSATTGRPAIFEVVAGHRRLEACRSLGWERIPAQVVNIDDEAAYRLSLIENLKRVDLNPMEEARSYAMARDKLGWTIGQITEAVNRLRAYVEGRLGLLDLPQPLQDAVSGGLPIAKAQAIEPLTIIEGAVEETLSAKDRDGAALVDWTASGLKERTRKVLEERTFQIKQRWDSEICKAKGCLQMIGSKPFCTDLSHAFAMLVEASEELLQWSLDDFFDGGVAARAGITREMNLPVYYDLDRINPVPGWRRRELQVKQPAGFPRFPAAIETYTYGREQGAATWDYVLQVVKGSARDKCLACPAYKNGKTQGRVLLVSLHEYPDSVKVRPICMVAVCRQKQAEASRGTPTSPAQDLNARKRAAVQPYLKEKAAELIERLGKDALRVLAATQLQRYRMADTPSIKGDLGDACARVGLRRPAHDGTPNGALKALMSVSQDGLIRALADVLVRHFDSAETYGGDWSPTALPATAGFLFGPKEQAEIKAEVKRLQAEARDQMKAEQQAPAKKASRGTSKAPRPASPQAAATAEPEPVPPLVKGTPTAFALLEDGRAFCNACMAPFDVSDDTFTRTGRCPAGHAPDGSQATE